MVMETRSEMANNPSPRSVGREFVRQYYTILHEGPQYLHRFYSQNSSFIHGGVEKPGSEQQPVIGQTDIHKKVMSLDFQDCHAKIRQVDSQATVGNGVVVQVTGELSKNGMQMRRFMQTFVLAPQSPKNYYVYNDIFRYQDEVFSDTESEKEDETADSENDVIDMTSQPEDGQEMSYESQPIGNGTSHYDDDVVEYNHASPEKECVIETDELLEPEMKENVHPEPEEKVIEDMADDQYKKIEEDEQPEPTGTFSWAALASKGGQTNHSGSNQVSVPATKSAPKPMDKGDAPNMGNPQAQRMPRPPREQKIGAVRERGTHSGSIGRNEDQESDETRKAPSMRHPDSKQIFVGNLPHDSSEQELKEFFEEFGEVVDVRINNKSAGGRIPNYAFVVFANEDVVTKVLETKPLKRFRKDQRLNVELKKKIGENRPGSGPRSNFNSGPRGPPMERNYSSRGGGGMGRGGMRMDGPRYDRSTGRQDMRGGMSRGGGGSGGGGGGGGSGSGGGTGGVNSVRR